MLLWPGWPGKVLPYDASFCRRPLLRHDATGFGSVSYLLQGEDMRYSGPAGQDGPVELTPCFMSFLSRLSVREYSQRCFSVGRIRSCQQIMSVFPYAIRVSNITTTCWRRLTDIRRSKPCDGFPQASKLVATKGMLCHCVLDVGLWSKRLAAKRLLFQKLS